MGILDQPGPVPKSERLRIIQLIYQSEPEPLLVTSDMKNVVKFYVEDRSKLLQEISTLSAVGAVSRLKSALQNTERILAVL